MSPPRFVEWVVCPQAGWLMDGENYAFGIVRTADASMRLEKTAAGRLIVSLDWIGRSGSPLVFRYRPVDPRLDALRIRVEFDRDAAPRLFFNDVPAADWADSAPE